MTAGFSNYADRQSWLAARKEMGIGSSEIAAVLGLSNRLSQTELWAIKVGREQTKDISDNDRVAYGTKAEKHLRALFALKHKGEYRITYHQFGIYRRPPFFSTLDGELERLSDGAKGIWECKTALIISKEDYEKWGHNSIPTEYYCQVIEQLYVTGWDFAILNAELRHEDGRAEIREYMIEAKDCKEDMQYIKEKGETFWREYVVKNTPPPVTLIIMNDIYSALPQTETIPETMDIVVDESFRSSLPEIVTNLHDVKAWLEAKTETDRKRVLVTDEDFEQAKKRCAELNKVASAIDQKRKEVKKAYTAPIDKFDRAAREVVEAVTTAKDNLWVQVKQAESAEKEKKKEDITALFDEVMGDLAQYCPLARVFDQHWLSRSVDLGDIRAAVEKIREDTSADVRAISMLEPAENRCALLMEYRNGCTVSQVIQKNELMKKMKMQIEEQTPEEPSKKQEEDQKTVDAGEEMVDVSFRVLCTRAQLLELKDFLVSHKIQYGRP